MNQIGMFTLRMRVRQKKYAAFAVFFGCTGLGRRFGIRMHGAGQRMGCPFGTEEPYVCKSFRWLKAKFAICVAFYNFIRPHGTLSHSKDKTFKPNTPAIAAGITTHQCSIKELLNARIYVN